MANNVNHGSECVTMVDHCNGSSRVDPYFGGPLATVN